jgi:hypothetical protein
VLNVRLESLPDVSSGFEPNDSGLNRQNQAFSAIGKITMFGGNFPNLPVIPIG